MVLDEDDVALQQQREFRVVKIFGTKGFSMEFATEADVNVT